MKTVVVGIVRKDDTVLVVQRKKREGELLWQFPAGEVEDLETPEAAVIREITEETGLECCNPRYLGELSHPSTGRLLLYFSAQNVGSARFG